MKGKCGKSFYCRRKVDSKIFEARCCEIYIDDEGDFDIVWQLCVDGVWKECSDFDESFSLGVKDYELKGIQLFISEF